MKQITLKRIHVPTANDFIESRRRVGWHVYEKKKRSIRLSVGTTVLGECGTWKRKGLVQRQTRPGASEGRWLEKRFV